MSIKKNEKSFISTLFARSGGKQIPATPHELEPISNGVELRKDTSDPSPSRIDEAFEDHAFRLAWDNDFAFHIAEHVVRLRRHRGLTQSQLAKLVGTSQPKIARIEGAGENLTVSTIERLIGALDGRLRFAIEPAECPIPRMPVWWDCISNGFAGETGERWSNRLVLMQRASASEPTRAFAAWSMEDEHEQPEPGRFMYAKAQLSAAPARALPAGSQATDSPDWS